MQQDHTPETPDDTQVIPERLEVPEQHDHGNYDVKGRNLTEDDADYDAEETNPKVPDGE